MVARWTGRLIRRSGRRLALFKVLIDRLEHVGLAGLGSNVVLHYDGRHGPRRRCPLTSPIERDSRRGVRAALALRARSNSPSNQQSERHSRHQHNRRDSRVRSVS